VKKSLIYALCYKFDFYISVILFYVAIESIRLNSLLPNLAFFIMLIFSIEFYPVFRRFGSQNFTTFLSDYVQHGLSFFSVVCGWRLVMLRLFGVRGLFKSKVGFRLGRFYWAMPSLSNWSFFLTMTSLFFVAS